MANTLTGLIPAIYRAYDVVSRELVGFIPSVSIDAGASRAAVGQTITAFQTAQQAAINVTPAMTIPAETSQAVAPVNMTISKSRGVPITWSGEEQQGVNAGGPGYDAILADQIAQAMRTLCNEVEVDLAVEIKNTASRAFGTAGTTPFATDMSELANVRKILVDNGAPINDLSCVLNTTAGAKMRSLTNLTKVNEAGGDDLLRRGVLLDLFGMRIRESAGCQAHTKGTGASYVTSGSTAVGATSIALVTGTGTVLAGDVVTFAADANNKYVINTGVAAPGTIVLNQNGARVVIATANAMTIGNNYSQNSAFARTAVALVTRAPALPKEGDLAIDRTMVGDPVSGLVFEVAIYPGFRQIVIMVMLAWGVKGVKQEHIATLLG